MARYGHGHSADEQRSGVHPQRRGCRTKSRETDPVRSSKEVQVKFSRVCVTLAVVGLVAFSVAAQTESQVRRAGQGKTSSADEVVSFKSDVPYADAIKSLGELWKKFTGKIVIDRSPMKGVDKTIGIN